MVQEEFYKAIYILQAHLVSLPLVFLLSTLGFPQAALKTLKNTLVYHLYPKSFQSGFQRPTVAPSCSGASTA